MQHRPGDTARTAHSRLRRHRRRQVADGRAVDLADADALADIPVRGDLLIHTELRNARSVGPVIVRPAPVTFHSSSMSIRSTSTPLRRKVMGRGTSDAGTDDQHSARNRPDHPFPFGPESTSRPLISVELSHRESEIRRIISTLVGDLSAWTGGRGSWTSCGTSPKCGLAHLRVHKDSLRKSGHIPQVYAPIRPSALPCQQYSAT